MTSIYGVAKSLRRGGAVAAGCLLALAALVTGGAVVQANGRQDAAMRAQLEPLAATVERVLRAPAELEKAARQVAGKLSPAADLEVKRKRVSAGLQAIARAFGDADAVDVCDQAASGLLFWRVPENVTALPLSAYPPTLELGVPSLPKVELSVLGADSFELREIERAPTTDARTCKLRLVFEGKGECNDSMRERLARAGITSRTPVPGGFRFAREWDCPIEFTDVDESWLEAVVGATQDPEVRDWSFARLRESSPPLWDAIAALPPAAALARLREGSFDVRDDVLLWGAAALGTLVLLLRYGGVARAVRQLRAYGDRLPGDIEISRPRPWLLAIGVVTLTVAMSWFVTRLQVEHTPTVVFASAAVLVLVALGFEGMRIERALRWKR